MLELNICLLPSQPVNEVCIRTSQAIAKLYRSLFTLDQQKFLPHLSLYHLGIPEKNLPQLIAHVRKLSDTIPPFSIQLNGLSQLGGYIFFNALQTDDLVFLQAKILASLNPLREGLLRLGMANLKVGADISEVEHQYLLQYGYPFVKSAFTPHITLSKVSAKATAGLIIKQMVLPATTFVCHEIGIGQIGPYGTCPKIIEKFRVQS